MIIYLLFDYCGESTIPHHIKGKMVSCFYRNCFFPVIHGLMSRIDPIFKIGHGVDLSRRKKIEDDIRMPDSLLIVRNTANEPGRTLTLCDNFKGIDGVILSDTRRRLTPTSFGAPPKTGLSDSNAASLSANNALPSANTE